MSLSDDALIVRCLKNDQEAGRELFVRYALFLYRLAHRTTLNQALAEEISQEAWLKIFQKLDQYQMGTSFRAWSAAICYNLCVDHLRKAQSQQSLDHATLRQIMHPRRLMPAEYAEENELLQSVLDKLHNLPEVFRTAFSLRYIEEMDYEEIADVMGCATGTARTRVFRAAQLCREQFA